MDRLINYIAVNWPVWVMAFILAAAQYSIRQLRKQQVETEKKNHAISLGVQAMLRDAIVTNYNKYQDKGYMPIYARESVKKIYEAYEGLGGNDVAHDLYDKMRHWDTDPDADNERR